MYRGTKIRMTDFLYETFRETVKSTSFKYWKKTVNLDFYTQTLKNEDKTKTFRHTKLKEFITSTSTLQDTLKGGK